MVVTRSYRTVDSVYATITQPDTEIGGVLRLTMPEPPTVNAMIDMAKERTRKSSNGGWMKRALPIVYEQNHDRYGLDAVAALNASGYRPPVVPWPRWSLIKAHFRLWNERDRVELCAGLKWPVDVLVTHKWVEDDSPRHLLEVCIPTQEIDRAHRGVDLYIRRDG